MRRTQQGYLLVTVIVTLFLVAAVAMLLAHDSSISANTSSRELENARAEYVAQAGMQHALWRITNNACMGEVTIPATTLGQDSYTATITGAAAGTSYVLSADQDAWIRSDDTDNNNGTSASNHVRQETGKVEQVLTRFDLSALPANAQINSAVAWFHIKALKPHPEGPITVYEITADWGETTATWDSFGGAYRRGRIGVIPAQDTGDVWVAFNLTGTVQAWVNGQPNNGILFESQAEGLHTEYTAREDGTNPPRLEVIVGSGSSSPLTITASGTLDNGVKRKLKDKLAIAYQPPRIHSFRPDPAGSEDAEIWDQAPNNNYGDAAETWVSSASNDTTRSLLRFDLGQIPAGAKVLDASLSLYRQSGSGADQPVSAHRVTNSWSEDSVSWNRRETGTNWDTVGGDFDSAPVATTPVGPGNQRYEWNITPLAQGWINGSYPNYGVVMVAAIDGMPGERFYTSDQSDLDRRPSLSVTYACECGSPCMAPQGSGRIALIGDDSSPDPDDQLKIQIIESWGYDVDFYEDLSSDTIHWSNYDLAYVSETIISGDVAANLADLSIGVVNEEPKLYDDLGLASGDTEHVGSSINISDNSHFITSIYPQGALSIYNGDMEILTANAPLAAGLQTLGEYNNQASLTAIDTGAQTTGGTAAGRRVTLPLGQHFAAGFDWTNLNHNGHLLVQRSIDWAMGADAGAAGNVLLVVVDPASLTAQEQAKKALIEAFGFGVNLIDESDTQANFDTAVAANDAVYVPQDISSLNVGTKLTNAPVGVVNEEGELVDELGISQDKLFKTRREIDVVDVSHYITEPFPVGLVTFASSDQSVHMLSGTPAPGLQTLGQSLNTGSLWNPSLATLDSGDALFGGGSAAGRRVQLPWGGGTFDINLLTDDGRTIMRRAIEWAAGQSLPGPIAHWKLDETSGTTAVDSIGGNDGTLQNGPVWTTGQLDGALDFDGANDYVITNNNFIPPPVGTVAFWMQVTGSPGVHMRILGMDDTWEIRHVTSGTPDGIPYGLVFDLGVTGVNTEFVTTTTVDTPGHWYHVAATYDTTTDAYAVYLDGVAQNSGTYSSALSVPAEGLLSIGTRTGSTQYFDGVLDDVRIYDRMLSAAEIAELAAPPLTLPIAHWKLDETSGTTAFDSIGGNDGNLNGSAAWISGAIGGGLAVNYTDGEDYIEIPNSLGLENVQEGNYTLAAWFRPDSTPPGSSSDNDANYGILIKTGWHTGIYFTNDNRFTLDQVLDGNTGVGVVSTNTFSPGDFHHVAGVVDRSAGMMSLYVNGQLENTRSFTPGAAAREYGTMTWKIGIANAGGASWGWPADGAIDDVRIYDRALVPAQVAELAAQGGAAGGGGSEYLDRFNTIGYNGTDGTVDWSATPWQEQHESDGPTSGLTRVVTSSECASGTCLRIDPSSPTGASRAVDLSGATTVTLSYKWRRDSAVGLSGASMGVAVSSNGGSTWVILAKIPAGVDASQNVESFDISAYATADTVIMFLAEGAASGFVYFDDVEIDTDGGGGGGGSGCNGTFRDQFDAISFSGSNGTLSWATDWLEVGESNGPDSGDIRVMNDQSNYQLRTRDNDNGGEGVQREADLTGAGSATLSYLYRRMNLDSSSDYTAVEVSANGDAGPWTELTRHSGSGNDSSYQTASHDISGYASSNTRIRFKTSSNMGGTDTVWFDDVQIQCTP